MVAREIRRLSDKTSVATVEIGQVAAGMQTAVEAGVAELELFTEAVSRCAGTAGEIGGAFFAALVKHLARALGTRCAWVTEYLPETHRLRALSFWVGDHYQDDYEYDVAGTPCEPVIAERGYGPITTEIRPAPAYYYAEDHHQQYLAKNPNGYRCHSATGVPFPADA